MKSVQNSVITLLLCFLCCVSAKDGSSQKEFLLAFGGDHGPTELESVERFYPHDESPAWHPTGSSLPAPRQQFATAVLRNKVYACGGFDWISNCLIYDPLTNSWDSTIVADLLETRYDFAMATLNGSIYAVGSGGFNQASVERYDAASNKWTYLKDFPVKITRLAITELDGTLYAAGGLNMSSEMVIKSFYKYDSSQDSWLQLEDMPTARTDLALVGVSSSSSSYLYAIGGFDGSAKALNVVERFNLVSKKWESSFPGNQMITRRGSLSVAVFAGYIYAVGGIDENNNRLSTVERLQIDEGQDLEHITAGAGWSLTGNLSDARASFGLASLFNVTDHDQ